MISGASILAMIANLPLHRAQLSISMPKKPTSGVRQRVSPSQQQAPNLRSTISTSRSTTDDRCPQSSERLHPHPMRTNRYLAVVGSDAHTVRTSARNNCTDLRSTPPTR